MADDRPGAFSRWMQRTMNARVNRKVRGGKGNFMGMDILVLNTVGRRSGRPRETPLAWYPDGDGAWLLVASGGGSVDPDWHGNLMAHPDRATIELPGRPPIPVGPRTLDGSARDQAWRRIIAANPRMAKYQDKSDRQYPIIRLATR